MGEFILEMRNITKDFPGVRALEDVTFQVRRGEIHALVGENGAGKSTLMKILSGVYRADEGEIWLRGKRVTATRPRAMIDAGVSVIYQELNLVPYLSVAENVFLGREPRRAGGFIDWKRMRAEVKRLLEPFGLSLDPRAPVYSIGPAYQQVVEIAKALSLRSDATTHTQVADFYNRQGSNKGTIGYGIDNEQQRSLKQYKADTLAK